MASVTPEAITAALKKLGPCRPGELADHLQMEHTAIGYHLKKMLDAGTLKAQGNSGARRIALPEQEFKEGGETAPPQPRTPKRKKRKGAKRAKPAAPRAPKDPRPAERFIPTVDAEKRLHIINGGAPVSYSDAQTLAIAELLFAHYEA